MKQKTLPVLPVFAALALGGPGMAAVASAAPATTSIAPQSVNDGQLPCSGSVTDSPAHLRANQSSIR